MPSRFLMLGVNYRLAVLIFLAVVTSLAGLGIPRLSLDTGLGGLIPTADPDLPSYHRTIREFGSDQRTMIFVRDPALWSPAKLEALRQLHLRLEQLALVERVDGLFNLHSLRGDGDMVDSGPVLPDVPADVAAADQSRRVALSNPLIVGEFLSADGTRTALQIRMREQHQKPELDRQIYEDLEKAMAPARSVFQVVFQVGPARIKTDLRAILLNDLKVLGPASAVVLSAVIFFFIRSLFAAWVAMVAAGIAIVWTLGMMGWTGLSLNVLCAMLPSLVVVVCCTGSLRMMTSYFQAASRADDGQQVNASRGMLTELGLALTLTTLIVATAFASNIVSSLGLVRDFAIASALAVMASGIVLLLFVPMAISAIGPRRTTRSWNPTACLKASGPLAGRARLTAGRSQRCLLLLTAALGAFFMVHLSGRHATNDPLSFFGQDHPLIRDVVQVQQALAGVKVFYITLESDRNRAFEHPRNIEKLVTIQNFLKKQGIFETSTSLAEHLAFVNRQLHGGDTEYDKVPEKREQVAQYVLFVPRSDFEKVVSQDFRMANIVVRHNVSDSRKLNRYIGELKEMITGVARGEITASVVGENLLVNAGADRLQGDQAASLAVLLLVIFLIMSAMFTSLKGGLIALLPNVVPVAIVFGLLGSLGLPPNPGSVLVAVIAIGIAIDGTIHLISRYNDLCRRTSDYEEAVRTAVQQETSPLIATYLALILGFGLLVFAESNLIAQFGALTAITMIFALYANLLITPRIMSRTRLVGLYQIWSLSVHKDVLEHSPLFQGMSNYQRRKAILISELNEFAAGDLLVEQGTFGRSMYVILAGQVEVARKTEGTSQRIAVLGPGQVFGEVGYINRIERTADVRAMTRVEALRFDYQKLKKDLKFFPHIVATLNFNISCVLGERLASAMGAKFKDDGQSFPGQ